MIPPEEYYDAISESYDELHGEEQAAKHRAVKNHIRGSVLDIAHGSGIIATVIDPARITGIDISRRLLALSPCTTFVWDFNEFPLPFPDTSFDTVICMSAYHHSTAKPALLEEMARIAKRTIIIGLVRALPVTEHDVATISARFPAAIIIEQRHDRIVIIDTL